MGVRIGFLIFVEDVIMKSRILSKTALGFAAVAAGAMAVMSSG